MDEQTLKAAIEKVNRETGGVVPYHVHNKIDSPQVDYNDLKNLPLSSEFTPASTSTFFEDFLGGNDSTETIGSNGWSWASATGGVDVHAGVDGTVGHPGIFSLGKAGVNENGAIYVAKSTNVRTDQGNMTIVAGVQLVAITDMYCRVGIAKGPTDDTPTGEYLEYDSSIDGNWRGHTQNGGSGSNTASGIAATTDWVQLKMVSNTNASSWEFFVDEVSIGSVTTTIPTQKGFPFFQVGARDGAGHLAYIDYYYLTITGLDR